MQAHQLAACSSQASDAQLHVAGCPCPKHTIRSMHHKCNVAVSDCFLMLMLQSVPSLGFRYFKDCLQSSTCSMVAILGTSDQSRWLADACIFVFQLLA